MKILKRAVSSIIAATMLLMIINIVGFANTCDNVRQNVLRLHVVAASDTQEDQQLKLKVRDALLQQGSEIFDGSVNIKNAVSKITPELSNLESVAKDVIKSNGFDYDVKVYLTREYFATKTYQNVTLPAGKYLALKAVIDEGEGRNWWCVMFPALCIPAASEQKDISMALGQDGERLVLKNPKYEPRFKIVEWLERIKNR